MRQSSHHPRLIDKEEKEEKDDSDDQQFPVHLVGSPDCFLDPPNFAGSMGSSTALPKQSVDLLTNRKVSLGLLVNEVSSAVQEVGGEVPCLWVGPNQVTTRYEGKDSQQVAAPTREPATAPTVVPRTVLLDLLPPTA